MTLTFADTHNMVAYLNKSGANEGFNQIIDFLNGSYFVYALTVNPTIYVSCIKQFWNTVAVNQSNDVTRIQALVDKKKVVVTEATIRDALHIDDAEGVDCLPNEEIFTTLARISYEKPVGKGCLGVETPLFEGMLVAREPKNQGDADEQGDVEEQGNDNNAVEEFVTTVDDVADQSIPSSTQLTPPPQQPQDIPSTSQNEKEEKETEEVRVNPNDAQVEGRQADIYHIYMDHATKVLSMQEDKPAIQEALEVVTTAKLITEVVAAFSETVSDAAVVQADVPAALVNAAAVVTTAAPVKVAILSTRRRRGVVIRDLEEESSAKTPNETKSKDKGKGIMVEEPKPMKKKQQVELDEAYTRKLQEELNQNIDWEVAMDHVKKRLKKTHMCRGMSYDDIRPIFEAKFNANIEFLLKSKEQMEEEESRAIAIINETLAQKAAKRRRLNKEAEDVE
nr:xylulose kinase-1 [Tanacetum cinerariifolium]